jgi:hypothetical protein
MNLRNTVRRLSQGSNPGLNLSHPATIIVAGLLFLLAGFSIVRFLLNFDQLQRLDEEKGSGLPVEAAPSAEALGTEANASSPEVVAWLAPLNRYRAMAGLAPVTADAQLSRGDVLHSHYLAINYAAQLPDAQLGAEMHLEDPARPGFTAEGAAAARASDVDWTWGPHSRAKPSWAIDNWMQAPFHRMQILNPYLRRVGYGTDCLGTVCFAALNSGADLDPPEIPSGWSKPLIFPPEGSMMDSGTFSGEWPNPLTACRNHTATAGLPITLELGRSVEPGFSDYSITRTDAKSPSIEACAFDANTYINSDSAAQIAARAILSEFGAIIIVPRQPLPPGRYVVALTAGQRYAWSFSISGRDPE